MLEKHTWVFFYGLYMDFEILRERGLRVQHWEVAKLDGYEFRISSWGYIKRSDVNCVYGVVVCAAQQEVLDLYAPATSTLPLDYFPEPVLVESPDGQLRNVLCYVATSEPQGAEVNVDYVEGMVRLARHFAFPDWYVERLESFRPALQKTPDVNCAIASS